MAVCVSITFRIVVEQWPGEIEAFKLESCLSKYVMGQGQRFMRF